MINASSPSSFDSLLSQALEMPEPAQTFSLSLQRKLELEAARINLKLRQQHQRERFGGMPALP